MKLTLTNDDIDAIIEKKYGTDKRELTSEEEIFIRTYVETLNKKLSWETAFNNGKSDPSGTTKANGVLDKPEIARRVADLMQKSLDADVSKSPNMLLKYIERYMELDLSHFYTDDGVIIPMSELSTEDRLLASNIVKQVNNRTGEILLTYQLPDKLKLLDHLSKLVTFVAQVRNLTGDNVSQSAEAAQKRDEIFNLGKKTAGNYKVVEDEEIVPEESP